MKRMILCTTLVLSFSLSACTQEKQIEKSTQEGDPQEQEDSELYSPLQ